MTRLKTVKQNLSLYTVTISCKQGIELVHNFLDKFLTLVEKYLIHSYIITGKITNKFGLKLNNDSWRDHKAAKDNNPYQEYLVHPRRFIFDNKKDIDEVKQMGITNLNKKYELDEIVKGDSIFCATGITTNEVLSGIDIKGNNYTSETLVTHKNSNFKAIIKKTNLIKE